MESWIWSRMLRAMGFLCATYLPLQGFALWKTRGLRRVMAALPLPFMIPIIVAGFQPSAYRDGSLYGMYFYCPYFPAMFYLIGLCLGSPLAPKAKDDVAVRDEELKKLAERGGMVKVRVELTSFLNRDAIRGDLERAGLEIDEQTRFEKLFSSGSVNWVTGAIDAARIEELAGLSFVKSVEAKGPMDGQSS